VVLASATPALESLQMAESGRYERLVLPSRFGGAPARHPIVDLREHAPERGHWLAPPLVEGLHDRLAKGEQSLLFLNRRGYAPLTLCRTCGYRFQCPNCSAWLVEHRLSRRLACHHCGHEVPTPMPAPNAASRTAWSPAAPAWSGSPMKWPRSCPKRAWRLSLRTR
jgi:primosomal protein N' (replication factor Y)